MSKSKKKQERMTLARHIGCQHSPPCKTAAQHKALLAIGFPNGEIVRYTKTGPRKASTALARVRRPLPARKTTLRMNDPHGLLPAVGTLGDEAAVGVLGQVEIKLTKAEEQVLAEDVNPADVLIKPSGQPYLSHPIYTHWFNRAFGRLGWAIVPQSKPIRTVNGKRVSVVVPYMLYIHGKPAAFAMGEQEYFEDSNEQTFGDALEATVASALRRCAKRLGVGLELWDKAFLQRFTAEYCVAVKVKRPRDSESRTQWRRKDAPSLPYELRGASKGVEESIDQTLPVYGENGSVGVITPKAAPAAPLKITIAQRQRLTQIIKSTGRNEAEVRLWLKKTYKVTKGEDILQKDYTAICDQLAVRGTLPMPGDGGVR